MATEIYRVKSGESLSSIARDLLGNLERWPEIAFLNGISHPYIIYPGQVLELPDENNSDIIEVVSTSPKVTSVAPITQRADFSFSPATVILFVIGATFFFDRSK